MRRSIIHVTLALCMLVTALYLAPQPARAEEAAPFDLAKAIRDAKTPAEHEAIASYYDQAAATAYTQAAEYRKIAEAYHNPAGRGQIRFGMESRYRQLEQYYRSLAIYYTTRAEAQRQLVQTLVWKPQ
jgi:hypothetical protein